MSRQTHRSILGIRSLLAALCLISGLMVINIPPANAASNWLPTSELSTAQGGKFTAAFKELVGTGAGIAMIAVMVIAFLVFAVAIVNAFWKMRKGDFELTDLGTIVITGALCAVLVVYALNEVDSVVTKGTGVQISANN